ncbi:oligopeptide/dipeptide ABC transporter, ATPase subunit [Desulfurococcus mucosus DSM 2162]|uniref:Oligopeptide/dipeptide ABC transporter, ATPase subunit n=1 Tax=Desulfurococcus mucosus (strain ATCC 35584 / DSM 2162 / JCM 9187 / O7/1) TaxID=765177 RepID=E8R9C6_DESM0|nr:ABC transporter ATP-binding protein [Desulfurococcus mucosus]ADV65102.1 oligopeptide/dipeptide ABC transporter, ATPase subunit [Desulfurococcus mucosus DSM 2162]
MSGEGIYEPKISGDTILFAKNLKVYFPVRRSLIDALRGKPQLYVKAVDGVSFDVMKGEVFALAGESGCGKTTTGKTILRLNKPTEGQIGYLPSKEVVEELGDVERISEYGHINVTSIDERHLRPLRKDVQMIWQDPFGSLNPRRTIYEILEEPLAIHGVGVSREDRYDIVAKALESVKLTPPDEYMDRYPHMLSGGQRQRVVIARALILNPKFVVADEPVSMLDVSIRAEILQLMMELKNKLGLTYLFITHDLAVARYISNRLAVMYLGQIVELGDARRVIENPLHPYTRALVEAIPEPEPSRRLTIREVPIKGEVPSPINVPSGCRFHPRCVALDEKPELKEYCMRKEPPMVEVEPGHFVKCWLYAKR